MLVESFKNIAIRNNNNVNNVDKSVAEGALVGMVVAVIILILLQFVVGPWLWNNVLRRLIPALRLAKAEWYDIFLFHVALMLIIPQLK